MTNEPDHPDISRLVHPPILTLLFIGMANLLERFFPLPASVPLFMRYLGVGMVVAGILLALGAAREFRKAHTTLDPHGSVQHLVTSGIYRFSRNPIYLGFLLMVMGFPLNSGSYWGLALAPVFGVTMISLVIEPEEAYLERKFKERYTSYTSGVRRWL